MSCSCCFSDHICHCIPYDDVIRINTSVTPGATYTWIITDKLDNEYSGEVIAESDGKIEIPLSALPDGLINQFGGKYKLRFEDGGCSPISIPLAKEYDCIEFTVKGGNREKNDIGCEVICAGGSTNSILVTFTDAETVTLDWSSYSDQLGNNPTIQVYHEYYADVFQLVDVSVEQIRANGVLTSVEIDNGGTASGYILLS